MHSLPGADSAGPATGAWSNRSGKRRAAGSRHCARERAGLWAGATPNPRISPGHCHPGAVAKACAYEPMSSFLCPRWRTSVAVHCEDGGRLSMRKTSGGGGTGRLWPIKSGDSISGWHGGACASRSLSGPAVSEATRAGVTGASRRKPRHAWHVQPTGLLLTACRREACAAGRCGLCGKPSACHIEDVPETSTIMCFQ